MSKNLILLVFVSVFLCVACKNTAKSDMVDAEAAAQATADSLAALASEVNEDLATLESINPAVSAYISENYMGYEVQGVEKVTTDAGSFLNVEIQKGEEEMELQFTSEGTFVKVMEDMDAEGGDEDNG